MNNIKCAFYAHFFCFVTNNNYMELVFIIIAILVFIITININITIGIEYNVIKNIGNLSITAFKIPFFKSEISLLAGYFNLVRKNRKVLQIKLDLKDENFKFLQDVSSYFTKKIFLTNISSDFEFSGEDPAIVSIIAGNFIVAEGIIRSYILSKSPDTDISSNTKVKYINNNLKLKFKVGILITIFDFIWAIIRALVKRSVYGKTKEFGRNS